MTYEDFRKWSRELDLSEHCLKQYAEERQRLEDLLEKLGEHESAEMGCNEGIRHNLGIKSEFTKSL